MVQIISHSVKETMALGTRLAKHLKTGDIVALSGAFGAGKTYFTKGIAKGLGVKKINEVISPSFILCNIHQGKRLKLYHFDAHRLPDARELFKLGLTEGLFDGVCVIEWADKFPRSALAERGSSRRSVGAARLNKQSNVIYVQFTLKGKTKRKIKIIGSRV